MHTGRTLMLAGALALAWSAPAGAQIATQVEVSRPKAHDTPIGAAPIGMTTVPAGSFDMGCHAETGETCSGTDTPVHPVLVDAFHMDRFETRIYDYAAFLNHALQDGDVHVSGGIVMKSGSDEVYAYTLAHAWSSRLYQDPSSGVIYPVGGYATHPMTQVSWYGAVAFANWRSELTGRTPCYDLDTWECDVSADGFRLPTEAEWEYAARGGMQDPYVQYPWGNTIDGSQANFDDSGDPWESASQPRTTPIGFYSGNQVPYGPSNPNAFDLYDMAGNAREWVNDRWDGSYYQWSPVDNPTGPATGDNRVYRGGSWFDDEPNLRVAYRNYLGAGDPSFTIGFRLVSRG